jgi:hypothetical protein
MSEHSPNTNHKRRSWNTILPYKPDQQLSSPFHPVASPGSTSADTQLFATPPSTNLRRGNSLNHHRKPASIDWNKSHRHANSTFSATSQFSTPATVLSRPETPDYSFDMNLSAAANEKFRHARYARPLSEQERLLQERLQELARSENARLDQSHRAELQQQQQLYTATHPQKRNSVSLASTFRPGEYGHQRHLSLQPYFNSQDNSTEVEFITPTPLVIPSTPAGPTSPMHSPLMSPIRSTSSHSSTGTFVAAQESARAAAYAKLSGESSAISSPKNVLSPLLISTPDQRVTIDRQRRQSLLSPTFVMSRYDLAKLGNEKNSITKENREVENKASVIEKSIPELESEPNVKNELDSHRSKETFVVDTESGKSAGNDIMDNDFVDETEQQQASENISAILHSIWLLLVSPEKLKEAHFSGAQWMPPSDLAETIKDKIINFICNFSLRTLFKIASALARFLGRGFLAGFALTILMVQLSLLSTMVVAYIFGDIALSPIRFFKHQLGSASPKDDEKINSNLTPEEQAKLTALKMQKAAKKAMQRRSSKRRSRH